MAKWYLVRRVKTKITKKTRSFKINSKSFKENQAKSAIILTRNFWKAGIKCFQTQSMNRRAIFYLQKAKEALRKISKSQTIWAMLLRSMMRMSTTKMIFHLWTKMTKVAKKVIMLRQTT